MQNPLKMNKVKCESLTQVRDKIDEIDVALIQLIALRQDYVDQAVRFKRTVKDVEAPERVEDVLTKVKALANEQAVDPVLVETIYRQLIQHFIQRELKEIRP